MKDMQWSHTEKTIARKAFDASYVKECATIIVELRKMTSEAGMPDDIWKIHEYLDRKKRNIENKYDYRYAVLIFVFAGLLKEGWITETDLTGLSEDKITKIKFLLNGA